MKNEFKIRCSSIGKIMTNPRYKSELISETAKTYCEEWIKSQVYNRRKEFVSKYTEKGLVMEDNSIDFAAEMLGYGVLFKNDKFFENDFMSGTPDIIGTTSILEIKSSWDCFTFPLLETEIPSKDYFYQMQGYMNLTGLKSAILVYCLMDTPQHLIEREARNYCFNNGFGQLDISVYDDYKKKMTYPDIDNKYKIKTFEVSYEPEIIEQINQRVLLCRDYINSILKTL